MKLNVFTLKTALVFSLFIVNVSFAPSAFTACNVNAPETTPSSDFTVNNDGTVTHNTTGLMWKVCSEGQTWNSTDGACSGSASNYNWQQALQRPNEVNTQGGYAGVTDWRLPNLKELKSIVELQCYNPAINEALFNNTPSRGFWSSSPTALYSDYSWGVGFNYGGDNDYYRDDDGRVRLVRSGQ